MATEAHDDFHHALTCMRMIERMTMGEDAEVYFNLRLISDSSICHNISWCLLVLGAEAPAVAVLIRKFEQHPKKRIGNVTEAQLRGPSRGTGPLPALDIRRSGTKLLCMYLMGIKPVPFYPNFLMLIAMTK